LSDSIVPIAANTVQGNPGQVVDADWYSVSMAGGIEAVAAAVAAGAPPPKTVAAEPTTTTPSNETRAPKAAKSTFTDRYHRSPHPI
jgi:hypothetical protein